MSASRKFRLKKKQYPTKDHGRRAGKRRAGEERIGGLESGQIESGPTAKKVRNKKIGKRVTSERKVQHAGLQNRGVIKKTCTDHRSPKVTGGTVINVGSIIAAADQRGLNVGRGEGGMLLSSTRGEERGQNLKVSSHQKVSMGKIYTLHYLENEKSSIMNSWEGREGPNSDHMAPKKKREVQGRSC